MFKYNGYYIVGNKFQLVQFYLVISLFQVDEDGLYFEWILYYEFMVSLCVFFCYVCVVEKEWVVFILEKLQNINIWSFSGLSGYEF